jgi:CubicO group peptidase (beta-lactamase class C family)
MVEGIKIYSGAQPNQRYNTCIETPSCQPVSSPAVQALVDDISQPHKGSFFYGQSEYSSECPTFASSKVANSKSESFTVDTIYPWASCGKILTTLALTKMMEEGLIASTTTLNSVDPVLYSGTSDYFDTINVIFPTAFPYSSSSYSYTTKKLDWTTITVENLLQYNIGLSNDVFFLPSANLVYFDSSQRSIILSENSVEGLGMMIQFGIAYSALVVGSPITPGCRLYNGEAISSVMPTSLASYIQLTKNGTIPLLYNSNTYSNDRLPFRIRSLPATYDFSYAILGDVMEKVLKKNNYSNFSEYVHQKIFEPLNMTRSYVLLQDKIPYSLSMAENSWRRSPVLSLTKTLVPIDPSTWPGCKCSPEYATLANGTVLTDPWGPLVWNSQYPTDGLSYISSLFYYRDQISGTGFLGNAPFVSSIKDMGTLLDCIVKKKSILNQTSWSYFLANKVMSSTYPSGFPYPLESISPTSTSTATALTHVNRDFSQRALYGFDDSTYYKNGITGCSIYMNTSTGIWMVFGYPEILLSSTTLYYPPPTIPSDTQLMSLFVTAVNSSL